jgi:hypothetical protein
MKFSARVFTNIILLALFQLFSLNVQAQTWSFKVYGCLAGGGNTTAEVNRKQVFVKTGVPTLDYSMLEDIKVLDAAFGTSIPVYFIKDDDEQRGTAFFTPTRFPDLIREEGFDPDRVRVSGSVFISSGLFIKEFKETNGSLMSIPAILGHEFGHGMQHSNNFPYDGKWQELHADYLAGWFIGHRGRFRPQNAVQAILNFYNKGDYEFNDKGHHGTPQERASAFNAGYTLNVQGNVASGALAYSSGLQYVRNLGAR